jgi:hypothetical protein
MNNQTTKRVGLSVVITLALLALMAAPVFAVNTLKLTIVEVVPGGLVKVQVENLPSSTEFAVRMGKAGTQGIAGGLVAHFDSGSGGTQEYTFEVHESVRNTHLVDLRIDDNAGTAGYVTFDNSKAYPAGSSSSSGSSETTTPATGGTSSTGTTNGNMVLMAAQQGGWVKMQFTGLPADTTFTVRIGMAGTQAANIYGYVVAHFTTTSSGEQIGTFEIPFPLRNQSNLDFRAEATGHVYVLTFENADQ